MQFSRISERRGIPVKGRVLGLVLVMGLIVAGAATYFSGALDATLLSDEAPRVAQAAAGEPMAAPTESLAADPIDVEPINLDYIIAEPINLDHIIAEPFAVVPAPDVAPTSMPIVAPKPTPAPTAVPSQERPVEEATAEDTPAPFPTILPVAEYGEVLSEGLVQLDLPSGEVVDTWYTFQVDTRSHEITLLFALYDESLDTIISSATIPNYTEGARLDQAQITLEYPNGLARTIWLDRVDGTITVNHQYTLPYGPSMFAPELRLAMVYYGINLYDETGNMSVALHLDLTGLSDGEGLTFKDSAPAAVESALNEIQELVNQVETRRPTN